MILYSPEDVQLMRPIGLRIISIAIFVGGIAFIAAGIILFIGSANFSDSVAQESQNNNTSSSRGVKTMMAKTVANALTPIINTLTQVTKGIITSIASFLSLVGAGLCVLGFALFKAKYFAWVLTLVLMFLAIVIDVVGLGFVGGSFTNNSINEGLIPTDLAYVLITILIVHLVANCVIIYYLTRTTTISLFRSAKG
jgi:magnesium-transporting ATPase (P-type)